MDQLNLGSEGVWVGELKSAGKSFEISKWEVLYAWEKVKANKGAAGMDGCSLEEFESDLKNQLYNSAAGAGRGDTETTRRWGPRALSR